MKELCLKTNVPIALDEELIGINQLTEKENLIQTILPQYIILKPSLHGGIKGCKEWIEIAESLSIPWWITSALESNIGLNAVAQFTGEYQNALPQGLGTGSLYTNNIPSNLTIEKGEIYIAK
jgi:O-succinylbenzoate synthase